MTKATFISLTILLAAFSCVPFKREHEKVNYLLSTAISVEDTNAVMALDMYEEAYDLSQEGKDSLLLRESCLRMGLLFLRHGLTDESIDAMHKSFFVDSALHDTISMLAALRYMAFAYESRGQISMAKNTLARITSIPSNGSNFYNRMECDYYTRYDEMKSLQQALPANMTADLDHLTPRSSELEFVFLGWNAEREGHYQDAISWYRKLSNELSSYVKAFALLHIAKLQLQMGNHDEVPITLNAYEEVLAHIRKTELTTKQLLQHHARYQDRRAQRKIGRLTQLNQRQWNIIAGGTLISVLVIGILLLMVHTYRQRQTIIKFRLDKMRQWREEYLSNSIQRREQQQQSTRQTDIYNRVRMKLNGGDEKPMNDADWHELETVVLTTYPHFRQRLYDLCRLSEHDYHVCLLLKLSFKPSDIARLTIRSDEAISSTRRRLYERGFGRKGTPAEWDEVIQSL